LMCVVTSYLVIWYLVSVISSSPPRSSSYSDVWPNLTWHWNDVRKLVIGSKGVNFTIPSFCVGVKF